MSWQLPAGMRTTWGQPFNPQTESNFLWMEASILATLAMPLSLVASLAHSPLKVLQCPHQGAQSSRSQVQSDSQMVDSRLSASSTITSSSEGPLYLSSSARTRPASARVTNKSVSFLIRLDLLLYTCEIDALIIEGGHNNNSPIGIKKRERQLAALVLNKQYQVIIIIYILPQMQVFLHHIDGTQTVALIDQDATLESLLESVNATSCRVVYQGVCLTSLESLGENANLYLTGDLDGGKKKKKKKVYTTKKKNKHIHKRVKLSIYTLYGVDGKGNVTQSRKTCPSCGPGTFMAQHWDRYYCGFCHTTIKMDAETIKKNEQIMKKKKAALEAEKKAKEKEAADKAPAGKGKKDAKKGAAKKK